MTKQTISKFLYTLCGALVLHPEVSSGLALFAGLLFGILLGNPFLSLTKKWCPKVLSYSIVGLGASMNLMVVAQAGLHGIGITALGITGTLVLGLLLGKLLRTERETSVLIGVGTAICGGSAIAAASAAIDAKEEATTVSLASVFVLNAIALFLFPYLGRQFGLTEQEFGLWSAIAIHDTSSVVGAAMQYGHDALQIATTTKLVRALWIVPLTLGVAKWHLSRNQSVSQKAKPKFPTFIIGFLIAAALVTFLPALQPAGNWVAACSRRTLVLALFFIGSALSPKTIKSVGPRPFLQAVLLWICVASVSLLAIHQATL